MPIIKLSKIIRKLYLQGISLETIIVTITTLYQSYDEQAKHDREAPFFL